MAAGRSIHEPWRGEVSEGTQLEVGRYVIAQIDDRNWTVEERTGRNSEKTGKEIIRFVGYYGDLLAASRSVLREGMKGQGATSVSHMIGIIEQCYADIERAVGGAA